jgi:hypothetical protein
MVGVSEIHRRREKKPVLKIRKPFRARCDLMQRHQLLGLWIIQWFQQYAIHHGEDRRVRRDSDRDGQ